MCDVCGLERATSETCPICGSEEPAELWLLWEGEGGYLTLWCAAGHMWLARAVARSAGSPGEYVPALCPECGLDGKWVEE